jgi:hypothetical protein
MAENINRALSRFFPFYEPSTSLVLSKPRFELKDDRLELLPNPVSSPEQLADARAVEALLGPGDDWYVPGVFSPGPLDGLLVTRLIRTTDYHRRAAAAEGFDLGFLRAAAAGPAWAGTGDISEFNRVLARRYADQGEALDLTERILIEFAQSVERAGSTPIVLVFPRRADVAAARAGEPGLYAPLLTRLADKGIPVVDLLQPLAEEARYSRTRVLFAPNTHYSPRANRVVAAHLAHALPPLTAATCPAPAAPSS